MTAHRWSWRAVLAALCVPMLSACVVAPVGYYDHYGYGYSGYGYGYGAAAGETVAVADAAPPAPYYEVRPVMPYVGAIWIGGYWNWYGGHHAWVPGYWGAPRPGYVWNPYRWAPYGGRWNLYRGGWARGR